MIPRRVVLLHGFTQAGAIWVPVMEAVTTRAPIDAPDLPGHGSASTITTDLQRTADDIGGLYGRGAYVGYSMGGRVALHLALAHPELVSHLVLCSSTAGIDDPSEREARRAADTALAAHVRNVGLDTFLTEWLSQPLFSSLTVTKHDAEVRATNTAEGLARSLEMSGTGRKSPCGTASTRSTCRCSSSRGIATRSSPTLAGALRPSSATTPGTWRFPGLDTPFPSNAPATSRLC